MMSLVELEAEIRRLVGVFAYPERDWLAPRVAEDGTPLHDVVILGAGLHARALAFALRCERIGNIAMIDTGAADDPCDLDESSLGGEARLNLAGAAFEWPMISFACWQRAATHEAQIAGSWSAYLHWLTRTLDLVVPQRADVAALTIGRDRVRVDLAAGPARHARFLVIADSGADLALTCPRLGAIDPGRAYAFASRPAPARWRDACERFGAAFERSWAPPRWLRDAIGHVPRWGGESSPPRLDHEFLIGPHDADRGPASSRTFLFGSAAYPDVGPPALPEQRIRFGVPRLLAAISRRLFLEDAERLWSDFERFETAERAAAETGGAIRA